LCEFALDVSGAVRQLNPVTAIVNKPTPTGDLFEHRPKEAALITQDTAIIFSQFKRGNALGIGF